MLYDRKIKYIHAYENNEKIQNVGFVKLEAIGDKVNIHIHIAGVHHASAGEFPVMAKGKEAEASLGKICLEDGKGCLDVKGLSAEQMTEGISYNGLTEIYMSLSAGIVLRCIIRENCEEIREEISGESPKEIKEENSDESSECGVRNTEELSEAELLREAFVQERRMLEEIEYEPESEGEEVQEEAPVSIKANPLVMRPGGQEDTMVMAADKWQQLWDLYPHMKPFEDGREYLVVKPRDFVILQNKYYTLSANSFLLHGYYNYEHLILCRETKRDEERYYIGVPGNFYEKEKQVAVLFGFESFEGKREPAGNGDFGYYMISVEI